MSQVRICLTTCSGEVAAQRLARALVERRLAACVNIVPRIRSVYRWRDAVHDEAESLLVIKTSAPLVQELEQAVRELHDYDVPEFVALDVSTGAPPYLEWILSSTKAAE